MRISRHNMFMEIARVVARRGTCPRLCVGAVVVRDRKHIVSIGYNGAPSGAKHCTEVGCLIDPGNGVSCIRADHAEYNALREASIALAGVRSDDISLYVTHSPCGQCAEAIVESNVTSVYFETPYRSPAGLTVLAEAGIGIFRVMPNGYIIEGTEGRLIEAD